MIGNSIQILKRQCWRFAAIRAGVTPGAAIDDLCRVWFDAGVLIGGAVFATYLAIAGWINDDQASYASFGIQLE